MNKHLWIIQGPTASGKTGLAVDMALYFNTEIISADSRQFYQEMSIGTAKPTKVEMKGVKHHFIDSHSLEDVFNVSTYASLAQITLETLFESNDHVILVGGSGQYIDAILGGLDDVPCFENIRERLESQFQEEGLDPLVNLLSEKDPSILPLIDLHNSRRVIRALEVVLGSGKSILTYQKNHAQTKDYSIHRIAIQWKREDLYQRINQRVDEMILVGLENEVSSLMKFKELPVFQTVGYKEWMPYFSNQITKNQVIEKIKQHSRNYAKRQLSWLNKYDSILFLDPYHNAGLCQQVLNSKEFGNVIKQ